MLNYKLKLLYPVLLFRFSINHHLISFHIYILLRNIYYKHICMFYAINILSLRTMSLSANMFEHIICITNQYLN